MEIVIGLYIILVIVQVGDIIYFYYKKNNV